MVQFNSSSIFGKTVICRILLISRSNTNLLGFLLKTRGWTHKQNWKNN